jgi:uncharacterized protein DUF6114
VVPPPVVSRLRRARRGWRSWRRSRPFWGGLLVVAGGAEIISTTLVSLSVTLRVGLGGVGGLLGTVIALVLVLCGVLLWLSAAQRAFYSIVAVVLALATFNTINLGGFLVGMLLGITGGALGFAWTPESQGERRARPKSRPAGWRDRLRRSAMRALPGHSGGRPPRHNPHRLVGLAGLPLALPLALAAAPGLAAAPAAPAASACIIVILCPSPSPSPHPSRTPAPAPSPGPTRGPGATPGPRATPSPSAKSTGPGSRHSGHVRRTAAGHGLVVASAVSTLTAGSARIVGLSYDGVAKVPRATGGALRMMKFDLQSVTLTGRPTLTISERGSTAVTTTSVLSFTGHVVLYATKLSGDLLGAPLTLTPDSPQALVLRLLKPFTNHLTVTMTNVVTGHPLTLADGSRWRGFTIRVH